MSNQPNNLCSKHTERQYCVEAANKMIDDEINFHGLKMEIRPLNKRHHFSTYCKIVDDRGRMVEEGLGKGTGLQSVVSAKFEAFEHAITKHETGFVQNQIELTMEEVNERGYQLVRTENTSLFSHAPKDIKDKWSVFTNMTRQIHHAFVYPTSMLDPFSTTQKSGATGKIEFSISQIQPVVRSNNGSAIGATYSEAVLHSLYEQIERYSKALIISNHLARVPKFKVKFIKPSTLPDRLNRIFLEIMRLSNKNLTVMDITSELLIPAFMVKMERTNFLLPPVGFGCSLNSAYALERALLECLQMYDAGIDDKIGLKNLEDDQKVVDKISDWPSLLSTACWNFEGVSASLLPFREIGSSAHRPEEQIEYLLGLLQRENVDVYLAKTYESSIRSICAVRTLIPAFSNFDLIIDGLPVTPSGRVLENLKTANSRAG